MIIGIADVTADAIVFEGIPHQDNLVLVARQSMAISLKSWTVSESQANRRGRNTMVYVQGKANRAHYKTR